MNWAIGYRAAGMGLLISLTSCASQHHQVAERSVLTDGPPALSVAPPVTTTDAAAPASAHADYAQSDDAAVDDTAVPDAPPSLAEREHGIELVGLRLSAAGTMLDLRYRVTNPDAARDLMSRKTKCYLIDPVSGGHLPVPTPPKVGRLRQTAMEPDPERTYFAMFINPGRRMHRGDHVSVVLGDCRIDDVLIEE